MGPFYIPWSYWAGYLLAWVGLCVWLPRALRWRQKTRGQPAKQRWATVALSTWLLMVVLMLVEGFCAVCVDQSDAFNMTNISRRWFRKYIDAQRNEQGFRDIRPFTRTVPKGAKRIVFLGDSFTVGHGIRRCEDRFSDLVGQELNVAHPGKYVVANLADPGMETSQLQGRLRAALEMDYQIDIVIYAFMMNDIEPYDPRTQEVIQSLQGREPRFFLVSQTYFPNWLYFRWLQARGGGADYFPHLRESYAGPAWKSLRSKLDDLHADCQQQHIDYRMVIFPFLHNLGPDYPFREAHRQLVEYCQSRKIPVLDLEPLLTPLRHENLTVNRFDAHPNEKVHALVANWIREKLLKDLFAL